MIKWIRPSGTEIETQDTPAMIDYAEKAEWKRKESKEAPENDNSIANSKRSSRKARRKNS